MLQRLIHHVQRGSSGCVLVAGRGLSLCERETASEVRLESQSIVNIWLLGLLGVVWRYVCIVELTVMQVSSAPACSNCTRHTVCPPMAANDNGVSYTPYISYYTTLHNAK
jgi:hypothetical protein